jgi:membrane protein implicated in regulation of membrane protease activity
MAPHRKGDLVHIPQAVVLVAADNETGDDPQLTIPLRIEETDAPKLGVVVASSEIGGYVRVFCDGDTWSVKNDNVYTLKER